MSERLDRLDRIRNQIVFRVEDDGDATLITAPFSYSGDRAAIDSDRQLVQEDIESAMKVEFSLDTSGNVFKRIPKCQWSDSLVDLIVSRLRENGWQVAMHGRTS